MTSRSGVLFFLFAAVLRFPAIDVFAQTAAPQNAALKIVVIAGEDAGNIIQQKAAVARGTDANGHAVVVSSPTVALLARP